MKININFLQTGGVPLTNDLMETIQEAYRTFEVLGEVAGHLTILKGCEVNGSTITPGVVVVNGEILPFEGGLTTSTVYIHTEEIEKTFQDQEDKVLITKKVVKFGNALTTYQWQDFVRLKTLKAMMGEFNSINARLEKLELKTAPIINGGIVLPFRRPVNEIPEGWKECTDFRGKTIVGMDPNYLGMDLPGFIDFKLNILGATGGSLMHKLTISEMPSHSHKLKARVTQDDGGVGGDGHEFSTSGTQKLNDVVLSTGGDKPHNNMSPYRIVMFIEPNFQ